MNEKYRDLEKQLESLQPRQPSSRVREEIATRLAASPSTSARLGMWTLGVAASAIAAGIIVALLLRRPNQPLVPGQPTEQLVLADQEVELPPTWLAYRRVLAESDESLDRLLDVHGSCPLAKSSPSVGLGALYEELLPN